MKTTDKRQVGRPVEKEGRKKIGLSIDGDTDKLLNELAENSGKTKSRIFEEAIKVMKSRQDIINARMKDLYENGMDAALDFDELVKNKRASEKELKEVCDVG